MSEAVDSDGERSRIEPPRPAAARPSANPDPSAGVPLDVKIKEWLSTTPVFTKWLTIGMLVVHTATLVVDDRIASRWCFRPENAKGSIETLLLHSLSSAVVHLSVIHIAMNMSAFMGLGPMLERSVGTVRFAWATLMIAFTCGLFSLGIAYLLSRPFFWSTLGLHFAEGVMYSCSAGFSGVLFAYMSWRSVREATLAWRPGGTGGTGGMRTLGYPWVLLFAIQLLLPNVSWLGHLSGLLAGYAASLPPFRALFSPPARVTLLVESRLVSPGAGSTGRGSPFVTAEASADGVSGVVGSGGQRLPVAAAFEDLDDGEGQGGGAATPPARGGNNNNGNGNININANSNANGNRGVGGAAPFLSNGNPGRFAEPGIVPPPGPRRVPEGETLYAEGDGEAFDRDVALLLSFGYPHERAVEALVAAGGNVEAAIALLDAGEV